MIDSSTNLGYSLIETPDALTPAEIKAGLKTGIIGKDIRYFKETESTNIIACEIAQRVDEGTVVIAESQTQGRGRLGRKWISRRRDMASVILKPKILPLHAPRITFLAGVSVARTIRVLVFLQKLSGQMIFLLTEKKYAESSLRSGLKLIS